MIAHDKFVFGYENDSLECSVSVLLTLRLSLTGRIRERKVSIILFLWSLGFALLIALSVIEFLQLPFIWALLCAAITLAFYASAVFLLVRSACLIDCAGQQDFYRVATAERGLW